MKPNGLSIMSNSLKGIGFGCITWAAILLAAPTVSAQTEIFNADVSQHILYTDLINPDHQIFLGGFSGLIPVPGDTSGRMFYTITDRGPTQDIPVLQSDGSTITYKVLPCPTLSPMIIKLQIHPSGKVRIVQTTPLKRFAQKGMVPITGFPNGVELAPETLCDVFYKQLPFDPDGLDPEGITMDPSGNFWICEEYRPSIAMVRANGTVLLRLVPKGCKTGTEQIPTFDILPAMLVNRVNNRGMEGITYAPNGCLYAVVQRPLANPNKKASEASCNLRIVEVNVAAFLAGAETPPVRQLLYRLDGAPNKSAYASDIFALSADVMLVPERTSDKLYAIKISEATDITGLENPNGTLIADPTLTIEKLTLAQMDLLGIKPVKKSLVAPGMIALHPELFKCEGVTVTNGKIVMTYDNDFNLAEVGVGTPTSASISLKSPDVFPALITIPMPDEITFE